MNSPDNLEIQFHDRMLQIYEQAKSECDYTATRFRNMVANQGGLQAARALLNSRAYSEGLTRLWEEKRLDISMEATVLKEPWRHLFTDEELTAARKKLAALGYNFEEL
jgi:hypothetical protein